MAGWRKRQPGVTRPPVPALLVYAAAGWLLKENLEAAIALLFLFSTYARPTEGLRILRQHLVCPGASVAHWTINLNAEEGGESSKVNLRNETLMLDDVELPFLGSLMSNCLQQSPTAPLFAVTPTEVGVAFAAAQKSLGVKSLFTLRDLRHGGPSRDRAKNYRSVDEVRQRGRWATMTTLRRYEAHARLQAEENKLPADLASKASAALVALEERSRKFTKLGGGNRKASSLKSSPGKAGSQKRPPRKDMRLGPLTSSLGMICGIRKPFVGLKRLRS